ncbi:type II toxin-antitoxin system HipA family toxin [Rhizobium tubonense]|nr:type II toxin-antitoxin system HipA family toxin [Rhizobium tubonense]
MTAMTMRTMPLLIVNRTGVIGVTLLVAQGRELRIGSLVREPSGTVRFTIDDGYINLGSDRPLVSLSWRGGIEDDTRVRLRSTSDKVMQGGSLPPFFQNMLPEGALRELVEKEFGAGAFDNFDVLARLGEDLPGALIARQEAGIEQAVLRQDKVVALERASSPPIRFSLAGVQLKFSVTNRGSLTIPAQKGDGHLILKTPSPQHALLPEVEWTALKLAEALDIRVAKAELVSSENIEGIPEQYLVGDKRSLVVERFDRGPEGGRIQVEDFAQIVGAVGDQKYTKANETTIMNIVQRFCRDSRGELLESVRRIVVNLMLGNGDAHLKNWSFIYPIGGDVSLTPAYDIVPTFLYGDANMALEFGGTKDPNLINLHKFERAAAALRIEPRVLIGQVMETVKKALDVWPSIIADSPITAEMKNRLLERFQNLPLVNEVARLTK